MTGRLTHGQARATFVGTRQAPESKAADTRQQVAHGVFIGKQRVDQARRLGVDAQD
jgi:hypothetical protein